ncbi:MULTISPECIES: hypothetical protein [unclassified Dysgonomonas]|jgi:hypothetical protein|uniref:hypothetical protein n=1 Tax=unclassified Dysgonomonas TaxID=2630389 RepID=UPI0025BDB9E8|nr:MULTISPECIES: hypothetical protein [unclassified Dysgonomonas]HMM03580.1 hypothetical protein [Dysgonomonas sp.]
MKLRIENWIENNNFSEDVNVLFTDAVTCYKARANRASLLFSYLAFLTILKERIIEGTKPNLFPQGEWDKLISKLQNEDLWEANVFDATQQQEKIDQATKQRIKDPIFSLNDNLRLQIKYWKDRRNDCAHYKDNIIDTFHIENFWAFMESNMSKITIEGGMQSLINKIYKHFDPTITPPDKDITPLIQEVEYSVERSKLKHFWETLLNNGEWDFDLSKRKQELISKSLEVNKDFVNDSLIAIVKANKFYLKDFLSNHTDKILRFNFNEEEVRKFWKTQLPSCNNILGLYTSFLRNGLIPQNEIAEANRTIISAIREYSPTINEHQILLGNGFLNTFKEEVLNNSSFVGYKSYLWVNDRADIISGVIKNYPPDNDIINRLVEHYNQRDNSDWLLERFNNIFIEGSTITNEYKSILQSNNVEIPEKLKKYFP